MSHPSVVAIHVGRPRQFETVEDAPRNSADGKPWVSGIIKSVVDGPVMVRRLNLEGDEQADLVHHGGVDKAVLCYPQEHYPFWASQYSEVDWRAGCFGENLTLAGLGEADVCIGDVFQLGDAQLQVSLKNFHCPCATHCLLLGATR